jgi:hypothetical protein
MHSGTLLILGAIGTVGALLIVAFIGLFFQLASRFSPQAVEPGWLDRFSLESYTPMERLLDASDFEFLTAQPGYRPEIRKRLLAERRKVFGEYLVLLVRDFNQLNYFAKLMLVHSAQDRPELARELARQQVRFYLAVCAVRCKVAFYPLGWTAVDVPKLLHALESMRNQIGVSALPPTASAAV